jgi:hypothetical protein
MPEEFKVSLALLSPGCDKLLQYDVLPTNFISWELLMSRKHCLDIADDSSHSSELNPLFSSSALNTLRLDAGLDGNVCHDVRSGDVIPLCASMSSLNNPRREARSAPAPFTPEVNAARLRRQSYELRLPFLIINGEPFPSIFCLDG